MKKNELTTGEIDKLEDSSRMFRGVGRMFMLESKAETVERLAAGKDSFSFLLFFFECLRSLLQSNNLL